MESLILKNKYEKIPYVVDSKSRSLIWKQSAGMLKGKIKNAVKKLSNLRKEWDRI